MYSEFMSTPERLIEATQELLWERGYVGTSPKAIQQRAGAGQGSMYHHFAGKPDLALAAVLRTSAEMRETAARLLDGPGSAYERISAYLLREREVLRGCPVGRLTMDPDVVASDALRAPVDETIGWLRGRLAEILQEGLDRGSSPPASSPGRSRPPSWRRSRAAMSWPARPGRRPRSTRPSGGCSPCSPRRSRRPVRPEEFRCTPCSTS